MNKIVLLVLFKKQIQKPKTFLLFIYLTFENLLLTAGTFWQLTPSNVHFQSQLGFNLP